MVKDWLNKIIGKESVRPHFEVSGRDVRSVGFPELDDLGVLGYTIGEGMAMFGKSRGPLFIVNTETNKVKKLVDGYMWCQERCACSSQPCSDCQWSYIFEKVK